MLTSQTMTLAMLLDVLDQNLIVTIVKVEDDKRTFICSKVLKYVLADLDSYLDNEVRRIEAGGSYRIGIELY